MFLLILIQTEKAFSGAEMSKKAWNKGLPRSIVDFGSPYFYVVMWSGWQLKTATRTLGCKGMGIIKRCRKN
jgi:hypothetical protein